VNPYVQRGYLNHAWINTMDNLDNVYTWQGFFYGYIMKPQHEK
jgi:hypothetical protein